jgi:hypothetical protein
VEERTSFGEYGGGTAQAGGGEMTPTDLRARLHEAIQRLGHDEPHEEVLKVLALIDSIPDAPEPLPPSGELAGHFDKVRMALDAGIACARCRGKGIIVRLEKSCSCPDFCSHEPLEEEEDCDCLGFHDGMASLKIIERSRTEPLPSEVEELAARLYLAINGEDSYGEMQSITKACYRNAARLVLADRAALEERLRTTCENIARWEP